MIYTRGAKSAIAQALHDLHPVKAVERWDRMPDDATRYLFCAGLQIQKPTCQQSIEEIGELFLVNAAAVIRECDLLIDANPKARICVMGSEAAFTWGFNGTYAGAKAALHRYVETKRLKHPDQQLVCVAPTHILNTGMGLQRNTDGVRVLEERRKKHQKHRWLEPVEVAQLVYFLLCVDQGYITNTVIRMNGGQHCL